MPLTAEDRTFIERMTSEVHVPLKITDKTILCDACSNAGEFGVSLADCEVLKLIKIIERITPKVFTVGDRVMAINFRGERLGRGRVIASQRENGFYMKVRLDEGLKEVIVPQSTSIRLVKKL